MRMLGLTSILMALGCSTAAANAQIVVSPETQTPGFSSAFSSRTAPTTGYGAQEGYGLGRSVGGSSSARWSIAAALDRGDDDWAIAEARRLSAAGDRWADRQLGWMYLNGIGAAADSSLAFHHLHRAAKQGDTPSALALGLAYRDGLGVSPNEADARYWLARARRSSSFAVRRDARRLSRTLGSGS
jgi:TPR repeat protein